MDGQQRGVLASIGLGLVDMTGLTTIYRSVATPGLTPYERGKMFGEGGTTLVLTVVGARSAIGKFRGRVPPVVPEPGLIGEVGADAVPDAPPANDVAPASEVPATDTPASPEPGSPQSVPTTATDPAPASSPSPATPETANATPAAPEANAPASESNPANDTSVDPVPDNVTPIERGLEYRARKAPQPDPVAQPDAAAQPRMMQRAAGDNTTSLVGEAVDEGGGRQADPNATRASADQNGGGSKPQPPQPPRAVERPAGSPRAEPPATPRSQRPNSPSENMWSEEETTAVNRPRPTRPTADLSSERPPQPELSEPPGGDAAPPTVRPARPTQPLAAVEDAAPDTARPGGKAGPEPSAPPKAASKPIRVHKDPYSIKGEVPGDPKAYVRATSPEPGVVEVTDVFRGNQPPGSGSQMIADTLRGAGELPTKRLVLKGVINAETLAAYEKGLPAEQSLLGRMAAKTLRALDLEPDTFSYEMYRGKLNVVVTVK